MKLFIFLFLLSAMTEREIDCKIIQLQDKKRGFESRALRHDDYAIYLQFIHEAYLETRRHIQLADQNREKAAAVQREIDALLIQKQELSKHE
jgi:hypothetical protein